MQSHTWQVRSLTLRCAVRVAGWLACAALAPGLQAQSTAPDAAALDAIPERIRAFVQDGTIAGAVTLVADREQVLGLDAVGFADLATQAPMRPDHLFWIASMTKPITATAILMLQDEGRLHVEDPLHKHLPEFRNPWLLAEEEEDRRVLRRPQREVTLRDLLTHCSGLANVGAPRPDSTLAELVMAYSQAPLRFEPGSRWEYSNSGINTLGRVIEVVSGKDYATFLRDRIFRPLGMKNTTFWPSPRQLRRVATSYTPAASGQGLEPTEIAFLKGGLSNRDRTPYPAGGLFSTAGDLGRFYQMLLQGGRWKGRTLVSTQALEQMTRTQTGDLKTGFTTGMSFGLGFAVVKEPQGVTAMLAPGTFGHGGAYGTQSWADPVAGRIYVLMIQRANLPNADASPVRQAFQEAAAAAWR